MSSLTLSHITETSKTSASVYLYYYKTKIIFFTELKSFNNCMTTAEARAKLQEVTTQVNLVNCAFGKTHKILFIYICTPAN